MIRIDVFYIEGDGYYFVPIYVADRLKDKLPNRAVIGGKPSSEWKEMQDDNFVFSLYKNDLLFVRRSKPIPLNPSLSENKDKASIAVTEGLFYYRSADISTASITCITHDNTFQARSLGIKTLHTFEKWTVDMLGNVSRVRRESRRGFDKEE
jgi:CRISPR-associated endonuclease Csn1